MKRVTLTTTSFSDSGLPPSITNSYVVRAEDAANNLGQYSNVVTLTGKGLGYSIPPGFRY